jgi:hypothetical protein
LIGETKLNLLMTTSESSMIAQFSFEFTLRRLDGDAPSTVLVRLAVGVPGGGLMVAVVVVIC